MKLARISLIDKKFFLHKLEYNEQTKKRYTVPNPQKLGKEFKEYMNKLTEELKQIQVYDTWEIGDDNEKNYRRY